VYSNSSTSSNQLLLHRDEHTTMSRPVSIIGAGIAGLTLSRCLLHRGIPSIIYDTASTRPRHNYAINLHATAYRPLLKILGVDESAFKSRVAVDAAGGGTGKMSLDINLPSHNGLYDVSSSFRANRLKLEELLREGVHVREKHRLRSIESTSQGSKLHFYEGESRPAELVIGADGVHSTLRKELLPSVQFNVLPYVVFNGKRRVVKKTLEKHYAAALNKSTVIEYKCDDILLSVSLNAESKHETYINWIYSRPARDVSDPLHRPSRTTEEARQIPLDFFHEVAALENLPSPFCDTFNVVKMRKEKVRHWLMRTTSTPLPDLQEILAKRQVCFLGDAVHAEPIVGGNGANASIIDAITLADTIANGEEDAISSWYDKRYPVWKQGKEESEKSIAKMHEPSPEPEFQEQQEGEFVNLVRKMHI
jgi:tyrosinase